MEYLPNSATPQERLAQSAKLGSLDIHSGQISEWKTLQPGDQVAGFASDGRWAAWVEAGVPGVKDTRWRVLARDLQSGATSVVDSLPATVDVPTVGYGTPIAVDDGRLAFSRVGADSAGEFEEVVVVDLATSTAAVIHRDSIPQRAVRFSLSGDRLLVVRAASGAANQLLEFDLGTPAAAPKVTENVADAVVASDAIFMSKAGGGLELDQAGQTLAISSNTSMAAFLGIVNGNAVWVDTQSHRGFFAGADRKAKQITDDYTAGLWANDHTLAWETAPHLESGGAAQLILYWIADPFSP